MAINNCFYIKNIGTSAVTIKNGCDAEDTICTFDYSINDTSNFIAHGATPVDITLQPNDKVYLL